MQQDRTEELCLEMKEVVKTVRYSIEIFLKKLMNGFLRCNRKILAGCLKKA